MSFIKIAITTKTVDGVSEVVIEHFDDDMDIKTLEYNDDDSDSGSGSDSDGYDVNMVVSDSDSDSDTYSSSDEYDEYFIDSP